MTERMPSLLELQHTDELLDQIGGRRTPVDGTGDDRVVVLMTAFADAVDEAPLPELRPAQASDSGALATPPRHRRSRARHLAGVLAVGISLSSSGIAAAVTGDPFQPIKSVVRHIYDIGREPSRDSDWILGSSDKSAGGSHSADQATDVHEPATSTRRTVPYLTREQSPSLIEAVSPRQNRVVSDQREQAGVKKQDPATTVTTEVTSEPDGTDDSATSEEVPVDGTDDSATSEEVPVDSTEDDPGTTSTDDPGATSTDDPGTTSTDDADGTDTGVTPPDAAPGGPPATPANSAACPGATVTAPQGQPPPPCQSTSAPDAQTTEEQTADEQTTDEQADEQITDETTDEQTEDSSLQDVPITSDAPADTTTTDESSQTD